MIYDHIQEDPKRPIDWQKVILLVLAFATVLLASIWEISLW